MNPMKTGTEMMRKLSDYKYSQISTVSEIQAEKERLRRKIRKSEKKLANDWNRIEDSWQIVSKIAGLGSRLFSSASLLGGVELGYKLISHFFSKKKTVK